MDSVRLTGVEISHDVRPSAVAAAPNDMESPLYRLIAADNAREKPMPAVFARDRSMRGTNLVATVAAVTATAVTGGAATSRSVDSRWYAGLRKPAYQPPRQAFPGGVAAAVRRYRCRQRRTLNDLRAGTDRAQTRAFSGALAVNLLLNAGWSWVFFGRRRLGLACIVAWALSASSADLTRRAIAARGPRALPLAAYPARCAFATALSTHIWFLNRR